MKILKIALLLLIDFVLSISLAQSHSLPRVSDFFPRVAKPGEWIRDYKNSDSNRVGSKFITSSIIDFDGHRWLKVPPDAKEGSQIVFRAGDQLDDPDIKPLYKLTNPRRIQVIHSSVKSIVISGLKSDINKLLSYNLAKPLKYIDPNSGVMRSVSRIVPKSRRDLKGAQGSGIGASVFTICGNKSETFEIDPVLPIGIALELIDKLRSELNIKIYTDPTTDLHPPSAAGAFSSLGSKPNSNRSLVNQQIFSSSGLLGLDKHNPNQKVYVFDTFDGRTEYADYTISGYHNSGAISVKEHGSIVGKIIDDIAGIKIKPISICDINGCNIRNFIKAFCGISNELESGSIINLSAGTPYESEIVLKIIQGLKNKNIYLVTSFGNHDQCKNYNRGDTCSHYPSDYIASDRELNISIAAAWDPYAKKISAFNRRYTVNNTGYNVPLNYSDAFLLPGEYYYKSASNGNKYIPYYGTSFSTPVLTGILSIWLKCFPDATDNLRRFKNNGHVNYKKLISASQCRD
ncbi:S8 family serine peptidase [Deinococcus sp. 6GRE01]|uniref:S8 family serine peptidase n=1 Tax=Deinococcus sp. 6GRE01 TaxID=2745873 RepID=UPI001E55F07A|nr:S8 family serine peptidase [Deinococcus sp. 6GRE01]